VLISSPFQSVWTTYPWRVFCRNRATCWLQVQRPNYKSTEPERVSTSSVNLLCLCFEVYALLSAFVWRLSVAYIGPKSRTERPIGRPKVAHVTRDSDTTFRVKRSKVKVTKCSGDRENVLGVGNYCYVASARRRARRWGPHGGGEGRGHIVSPRTQLVTRHLLWVLVLLTYRMTTSSIRSPHSVWNSLQY